MGFLSSIFDKNEALSRKAFKCAMDSDFAQAIEIVRGGADVNRVVKMNFCTSFDDVETLEGTLGYMAIRKRNAKALAELLDLGLDPEIKSGEGEPLIAQAIKGRYVEAAELLLNHGVRKDFVFKDLDTLEERARKNGMQQIADLIAKPTTTPSKEAKASARLVRSSATV